jgi:signal transduction histidine kinase
VEVAVPPGIGAELRTEGDESRLPPGVRGQIFSILREGVRNAVRHSGADHVLIEFGVTQETVTGSVEDDGRGIPESAMIGDGGGDGAAGVGLRSMKERAALLGGHLRLLSPPGGGTRLEFTVPLGGSG